MELGYALSSEEHPPRDLVDLAQRAEEVGFPFALISDHIHPWIDRQGHSPFVWSILGGIAERTTTLRIGTGVTCPLVRTHPGIIAHAAATTASLFGGRFFLGVGTGEALNEHVFGDRWPPADVRLEMLREAIDVMRLLWEGGSKTFYGRHYTIENLRIYDLPDEPIGLYVAASGEKAAALAGEVGDALISTKPANDTIEKFEKAGGAGKPKYGQLSVCWAATEEEARKTAFEWWPSSAVSGQLSQDLPTPEHFKQATQMVTEDDVADRVICGPDPQRHLDAIREYADAGYDHVYFHQIGPDQEGFFRFYEREILPKV